WEIFHKDSLISESLTPSSQFAIASLPTKDRPKRIEDATQLHEHELGRLVIMGIRQHGRADIDSGRQSRPRHDQDECTLLARDNFYAGPGSREVHRHLITFREWLDLFCHLRGCVSGYRKIDLVVRRSDRTRAGFFCSRGRVAG